jgi:general secretion pathway protein K
MSFKETSSSSGIALVAVMVALMLLSAIALGLATSVQTEARIDAAAWDGLQAEELARSGQEFASFLAVRGLRKTPDFLAGLPFEAIAPGFHYRAQVPGGAVDIYFEADNGKLDLNRTPPEVLTNFFTLWTGDFTKAQLITAAIEDWRDSDNDVRPNGAEAAAYTGLGYTPRNGSLGIADAPLIRGLRTVDFQVQASQENGTVGIRQSLDSFLTSAGAGAINANFAPELILRSVPGLNESQVEAILSGRSERPFDDANDLQTRIGLAPNAPAWQYLSLARGPDAVSSIARLKSSGITRLERRVTYSFNVVNIFTGIPESRYALGRVQRGTSGSFF